MAVSTRTSSAEAGQWGDQFMAGSTGGGHPNTIEIMIDKDDLPSNMINRISSARVVCGTRAAEVFCAVGSWGGRRPSLVPYVTVTRPKDGATASGGRSCCLSSSTQSTIISFWPAIRSEDPRSSATFGEPLTASF
jgi:hypothetical protein